MKGLQGYRDRGKGRERKRREGEKERITFCLWFAPKMAARAMVEASNPGHHPKLTCEFIVV